MLPRLTACLQGHLFQTGHLLLSLGTARSVLELFDQMLFFIVIRGDLNLIKCVYLYPNPSELVKYSSQTVQGKY